MSLILMKRNRREVETPKRELSISRQKKGGRRHDGYASSPLMEQKRNLRGQCGPNLSRARKDLKLRGNEKPRLGVWPTLAASERKLTKIVTKRPGRSVCQ